MDFTVKNVSKRFGPTVAVDNVSVRFAAGEIRAIVGENGAGKSTLLKIVSGIHKEILEKFILMISRLIRKTMYRLRLKEWLMYFRRRQLIHT